MKKPIKDLFEEAMDQNLGYSVHSRGIIITQNVTILGKGNAAQACEEIYKERLKDVLFRIINAIANNYQYPATAINNIVEEIAKENNIKLEP